MSGRPQRSLAELLAELPDELAAQAFSHSSWVPRRTEGYGRLAFLGDSVLGLAVASRLFGELADADIGELTSAGESHRVAIEVSAVQRGCVVEQRITYGVISMHSVLNVRLRLPGIDPWISR